MRCLYLTAMLLLAALLSTASSMGAAQPGVRASLTHEGEDYVNMRDVCARYDQKAGKDKQQATHSGNSREVSFTITTKEREYRIILCPGRQDFYVATNEKKRYLFVLSHRVLESNGNIYISSTDFQKLVDPVFNPELTKGYEFDTVVLDPGHGAHDAGATSPYAVEKRCNLSLALKVKKKLEEKRIKVVMTRESDRFLTLGERVSFANEMVVKKKRKAIFVSIHHNSSSNRAAKGIETFTLAPHGTTSPFARTRRTEILSGNNQDSANIALAAAVHSHVLHGLSKDKNPTPDRGIQRARFSVLCTIRCPAILFEAGFVSNAEEGRRISNERYQEKLAEYIVNGIMKYKDNVSGTATNKASGTVIRPGRNTTSSRTGYR